MAPLAYAALFAPCLRFCVVSQHVAALVFAALVYGGVDVGAGRAYVRAGYAGHAANFAARNASAISSFVLQYATTHGRLGNRNTHFIGRKRRLVMLNRIVAMATSYAARGWLSVPGKSSPGVSPL